MDSFYPLPGQFPRVGPIGLLVRSFCFFFMKKSLNKKKEYENIVEVNIELIIKRNLSGF